MPQEVINCVHVLARRAKNTRDLIFANGKGNIPDNNSGLDYLSDKSTSSDSSSAYSAFTSSNDNDNDNIPDLQPRLNDSNDDDSDYEPSGNSNADYNNDDSSIISSSSSSTSSSSLSPYASIKFNPTLHLPPLKPILPPDPPTFLLPAGVTHPHPRQAYQYQQ